MLEKNKNIIYYNENFNGEIECLVTKHKVKYVVRVGCVFTKTRLFTAGRAYVHRSYIP